VRVLQAAAIAMLVLGWLWWLTVQLIMTVFMVIGWLLLIPFCLAHAWTAGGLWPSINPTHRMVDRWSWRPLNWIYGNPEDGVSGLQALVWNSTGTLQGPYMPLPTLALPVWYDRRARIFIWLFDAWRAYCWSGWRNSCDNLKYVFAWSRGPQATILGHKIGWWLENGKKVPLL
jgi:hypothetical protein